MCLFWCFRHMYEDQKTRSAIFEGGGEQSAASLISKCSHGAVRLSSAQLSSAATQAASLLDLHLCLCTPFLSNKICSHLVWLQTTSAVSQTVRSTWMRTLERQRGEYSLPQMNPVLSLALPLMADNCGMILQIQCQIVWLNQCYKMKNNGSFVPM